jgi:uncharacterized protein (DUF1330 family)
MPKGYVISCVDFTDPGEPLARRAQRNAVGQGAGAQCRARIRELRAARRYFYSEQHQAARKLQEGAAEIEMVLVEGV